MKRQLLKTIICGGVSGLPECIELLKKEFSNFNTQIVITEIPIYDEYRISIYTL
ncbi:MAG: hypothetical protein MJ222_01920 [Bacilli bacterium]|nr:hypothetical protein [Bacilli bacterium]